MNSTPDISAIVGDASSQVATPSAATGSGGCEDCTMCEKSPGLVILPVRYSAIAESHAHTIHGLTPISQGSPFGEGVLDKPMQHASYILRCMRQGYFYLHFPTGDAEGVIWRKYAVTSDSNFIPLPLDAPLPDIEKNEACRRSSDWQMARCVTISTPEEVSAAWLAFSDTHWDESIRQRVAQNPSERMQFLSPAQCIGGGAGQPHTAPLSELTNWVSEYRPFALHSFNNTVADLDDDENTATFESVYPFHWRAFEANTLIETAERKSDGRAIVFATHDPRGITVELNAEQIQAVAASLQLYSWRITSWEGVQAIKNTVQITEESIYRNGVADNQAMMLEAPEARLREARRRIANGTASPADQQTMEDMERLLNETRATTQHQYLDADIINARRQRVWRETRNDVWFGLFEFKNEYLRMSDEELKQDFKSNVADNLKNDQENIHAPISEDHATWLGSNALKTCFECDYRTDDLDSGTQYVHHFIECLEDAADRAECEVVIQEWVSQPALGDSSNLLMRSLIWNQDEHARTVNDLSGTIITTSNFQMTLDKINNAWEKSRKHMFEPAQSEDAAKNVFSQLLYQTGAPVAKFLSRQLDSAAMNVYLAASMLSTGRLMLQRPLEGTPQQHVDWLTAQMRERIPRNKRPSANQMRRVTQAWLKAGGAEPSIRIPNIILLDDDLLRRAADGPGSGRAAEARLLRSSEPILLTSDNIRETALPKFQAFVNADTRIAAVGLLFSTVSTLFSRDQMKDADVFADEEAAGRYYASGVGLIGGILNATETGIKRMEAVGKIGELSKTRLTLRWSGRVLGALAAWGFAYFDAKNAVENAKKGNWTLVFMYGFSAGANAVLGFMSIFTSLFAGWPEVIFMVTLGVNLIIEKIKDSEAQKWLKHCFYGTEERWPSVKVGDKELEKVLGVWSREVVVRVLMEPVRFILP
ncbi:T6SS effector BTH_I2691 family protein, partial [Kushneria avicenniae]